MSEVPRTSGLKGTISRYSTRALIGDSYLHSKEHCLPADNVEGRDNLTYQRAIDIARNTEGELDKAVIKYLDEAISSILSRIDEHPETYILTKDEFAVFSYYIRRFEGNVAEQAIDRYWRNTAEHPPPRRQANVQHDEAPVPTSLPSPRDGSEDERGSLPSMNEMHIFDTPGSTLTFAELCGILQTQDYLEHFTCIATRYERRCGSQLHLNYKTEAKRLLSHRKDELDLNSVRDIITCLLCVEHQRSSYYRSKVEEKWRLEFPMLDFSRLRTPSAFSQMPTRGRRHRMVSHTPPDSQSKSVLQVGLQQSDTEELTLPADPRGEILGKRYQAREWDKSIEQNTSDASSLTSLDDSSLFRSLSQTATPSHSARGKDVFESISATGQARQHFGNLYNHRMPLHATS